MDAVETFARHVTGTALADIPAPAVRAEKIFILDSMGVGIAGSRGPLVDALRHAELPVDRQVEDLDHHDRAPREVRARAHRVLDLRRRPDRSVVDEADGVGHALGLDDEHAGIDVGEAVTVL